MKRQHSLSRPLRRRSPDLQRLIDDGYCLTFREVPAWLTDVYDWLRSAIRPMYWHEPREWITVKGIPYIRRTNHGSDLDVAYGQLAVPLWIERDASIRPKEHWALWYGDVPCFATGEPRVGILAPNLAPHRGVIVLSQKPPPDGLHIDHHDKILTYVSYIEPQAQIISPGVSARCQCS